ncbi:TPA: hypothetical protein ACPJ1O_000966 [Vibrio diabolicus]|uniref:Uncharacterized protein n=1 Tax=Vibrio chemaguriensis TaxID=2527672 RepID=A0ABX1HV95_9VIBR|nr:MULTISPECIES: hypothetical protein [Vibrio]EGR3415479.1 hypothetical protein [Vibrio parahaemolyticus]MBE5170947.1 hypothetical protein [Vibrio parahaemolyticus]MCK8063404.1 hypothetical protein [Vibrio sp. 1CM7H]NKJ67680.1 hypothetical protein [Vibrio chemaguriensis]HCE3384601.1 hypothetical protein [Vibrio parahaemolyticus]
MSQIDHNERTTVTGFIDQKFSIPIEVLTRAEWTQHLQKHYLSVDGPYGQQPLEWLNATAEDLAEAVGYPDTPQDQVLDAFMKLFSRKGVRRVLGNKVSKHQGMFAYNNFHYLVLSCFVTSTPIGAGDNKDFRDRLGELFHDGNGREQGVSGVNSLWEALAEWVNKSSSWRPIVLPDPGSYINIGIALKLAYPSWEDLAALKKILKKAQVKDMHSRYALLQHIRSCQYELPALARQRIGKHINELEGRFRIGRPIENHAFWRIVERVLYDISNEEAFNQSKLLWRISVDFYGAGESGIDVLVARGNKREELSQPCWEGSFRQLLSSLNDPMIPVQLQQIMAMGTVLLFEGHDGLWTQDDRPVDNVSTIILTNVKSYIYSFRKPLELERGWFISEKMDIDQAKQLTFGAGIAGDSKVVTRELSIEGGIKDRLGRWLGIPGYFPYINLPESTDIESSPELNLQIQNHVALIGANNVLDGQWNIQINGDQFYKSLDLSFTSKAARNEKWPSRPENGFVDAQEVQFEEGELIFDGVVPVHTEFCSSRLLDVLEAIYARAGATRSERDILSFLKPVLPGKLNPWDLLRSLEEAGWLKKDVSKKWCGRRWRVLPPRIVKTGHGRAIIEGATSFLERELLEVEAKRHGVNYFFNAEHPWSVPVIGIEGENLQSLADDLNWPLIHAREPLLEPAPSCWFTDSRTHQGRKLESVWCPDTKSFKKSEFRSETEQLQLYRYVRDDSQDFFCITNDEKLVFGYSERLAALLEYSRQTCTSLFASREDSLIRQAKSGYLPLCISKWLRRVTAQQSGPRQDDSEFCYGYGVTSAQLTELKRIFGQAIGDNGSARKQNIIQIMAQDRQRGQRSHWPINKEL